MSPHIVDRLFIDAGREAAAAQLGRDRAVLAKAGVTDEMWDQAREAWLDWLDWSERNARGFRIFMSTPAGRQTFMLGYLAGQAKVSLNKPKPAP